MDHDSQLICEKYLIEVTISSRNIQSLEKKFKLDKNSAKDLLERFNSVYQRLPNKDIFSYNSVNDIEQAINSITASRREIKVSGARSVFENELVKVVRVFTYDAGRKYGARSKWCFTSREDPSFFDDLVNQGAAIYIAIGKDGKKYALIRYLSRVLTGRASNDYQEDSTAIIKKYQIPGRILAPPRVRDIPQIQQALQSPDGKQFIQRVIDRNNGRIPEFENYIISNFTSREIATYLGKMHMINEPGKAAFINKLRPYPQLLRNTIEDFNDPTVQGTYDPINIWDQCDGVY